MQMPNVSMPFNYIFNQMIDKFSKYLNSDEMPFYIGKNHDYEYFHTKALQTQYRAVSKNIIKSRTIKLKEHKCYMNML